MEQNKPQLGKTSTVSSEAPQSEKPKTYNLVVQAAVIIGGVNQGTMVVKLKSIPMGSYPTFEIIRSEVRRITEAVDAEISILSITPPLSELQLQALYPDERPKQKPNLTS